MEQDMFPILKRFLEEQDYSVKAEIMNADIVAKKEDIVIVIEMKTSFSTKLIYQGIQRLHISDFVYLAIPRPTTKVLKSATFKEKKTIVRRLEIGLILVDIETDSVEVLLDPRTYHFKKNKKKRRRLLKEFHLRKTSLNIGGVTKTRLITAYRELALLALDAMKDGPKTTKYLREYTSRKKVVNILQKNYYGWFERVERGTYQLTDIGHKALDEYQNIIIDIKQLHSNEKKKLD